MICASRLLSSSAHLVCSSDQLIPSAHLLCSSRPLISVAHLVCPARLLISSAHLVCSAPLLGLTVHPVCACRLVISSVPLGCLRFRMCPPEGMRINREEKRTRNGIKKEDEERRDAREGMIIEIINTKGNIKQANMKKNNK